MLKFYKINIEHFKQRLEMEKLRFDEDPFFGI